MQRSNWWLSAAALLLWSCGGEKIAAPPLPKLDAAKFEPAVRDVVERAAVVAQAAPDDAAKVTELGVVLQAHDQFAAAAAVFRRAVALDPSNAETSYLLGVALAADGKYAEAVEPLKKALRAKPDAAAIRLKLADSLLAAGDTAAARHEYEALLAKDSSLAGAHYGLGRTLPSDDATREFAQALALFPRYGAAQFALAAAYRRAGQTQEADRLLTNYERDKTLTPPLDDPALERVYSRSVSSTGLLRKAQILEREGDVPAALAVHEEVIARDPKLDQAWINLISLYARLNRTADAERAYRRAIELAPNRADAYYNFGVFCFGQERFTEARAAFQRALSLDPNNAEAAHNLGAVVERTGDLAQARALFQKALALKPDHRLAHFHLGRIYANERRYDLAIAEFERIIEPADEQSPTYLYALAAAQARAGRKQQAYASLNRAKTEAARLGQTQLVASIERDLGALMR